MAHETSGETRDFHIGDILSITTGRLVSPRHIEGVYDILDFMTGDELSTIALPRAARECAPSLLEQHPDLAEIEVPRDLSGMDQVRSWLGTLVTKYGESRPVTPLTSGGHEFKHPLQELADMGYADKTIVVVTGEAEKE